ncbi:RsmF rRNA methyltransferase first C-terminal domain-containing protein [Lentilactobacillus sp. SPB1-3]|uniref:RsmF rRNA methyltransferase first C-terminal domain-containing protein n=1 Tax=Lentilactobacillus terminaliae TaxID=3003483 RepID=A0ACD5DC08_9LACO|nr:RsmF rRNA methyltransferase first C-terminal domain-containing protein [Lentilactobacillus sp. SPB1-3]MCZ0977230.1 RsmF rRNA methyltransferase first C-terminal domain-containing protein [Lentilactobacillus sp. SPB1-3]
MELPADFKQKYTTLLGETEAKQFFDGFDRESRHGFRINPLKENVDYSEIVDTDSPAEHSEFGYFGKVDGKSVSHQAGLVYSQEPSAMFVGEVAHPNPGERVLDLCAAPGGKTTHLGSFMRNQGILVANEINSKRASVLAENVERFSLRNAVITNTTPEKIAQTFPEYFDKVLVDAPCSGEGMFRKDPAAMDYWSLDYPEQCTKRQRDILTEAYKVIKPGGQLIYSTCTFAPEEDEEIISWLLENFDLTIEPIKKFSGMDDGRPEWGNGDPSLKDCVRLFPFHFAGEGHFIAKLVKGNGDTTSKVKSFWKNKNLVRPSKDELNLYNTFLSDNHITANFDGLVVYKNLLFASNYDLPDLSKVKVVRIGMPLGEFKKGRFEPSFALGLALTAEENSQQLPITHQQWADYVHGDVFSIDQQLSKGWYQLVFAGLPVGFGKLVGQTVKNFYPKGLRFKAE